MRVCGINTKEDPQAQILSEFGLSSLIKDTRTKKSRKKKKQTPPVRLVTGVIQTNPYSTFRPLKKPKPAGRFRKG